MKLCCRVKVVQGIQSQVTLISRVRPTVWPPNPLQNLHTPHNAIPYASLNHHPSQCLVLLGKTHRERTGPLSISIFLARRIWGKLTYNLAGVFYHPWWPRLFFVSLWLVSLNKNLNYITLVSKCYADNRHGWWVSHADPLFACLSWKNWTLQSVRVWLARLVLCDMVN